MNSRLKRLSIAVVAASALMGSSTVANANLVLNGETTLGGQGFGNAPRLLTIQARGNGTFESGAIGISEGNLVAVSGISDAQVFGGNGVTNAGGDEVNPLSDNQKFGIPTLGSLNWTSGANVNLLFNATEPGGNGLTVNDVTLKFYNGNNVIAAIDGSFSLASTTTGTGVAGFLISVDASQQTFLNGTVFNQVGASNFRIALEASISGVAGGSESFSAISVAAPVPEPEIYAMMGLGLGLMGWVAHRKKRQETT